MRIVFCGGGTAGHVSPAIAISEAVHKENPNTGILFIGRENGEENKAIEKSGYCLQTIKMQGISRSLSYKNFKSVYLTLVAMRKAQAILKSYSPDLVIGTGGYVCFPVIAAAQKMKIPTMLHESNACPGLATKLLAKKCARVLLNLNGSENEFKMHDNIRIVGTPVKDDFTSIKRKDAKKRLGIRDNEFFILSFGGSGGSAKLNEVVIELMLSHSSKSSFVKHTHASGSKYFSDIKSKYPALTKGENGCIIKPYIDDMPLFLAAADTVISRCGAMTIAEISAVGAAAILIPSPNVTNNHQYKNAKLLYDAGAAIMIEEQNLNERELLDAVRILETNLRFRNSMGEKIKKFYHNYCKKLILTEIHEICDK
jgi:UDP-N-acetylglucosamine--N-acetylmuramyl-(pentapeptide) pyrophosphoryl-undecaprenol N-acetylglucosamine transferase